MNQRWQSLVRPQAGSHDHAPNAIEALGVWILGVLWAVSCLWLGYLGGPWVVPGVLLAGLLAVWGWKHMEWLWWFPTVLVVATLIQPLSPLPKLLHFGPLVYIDLLTLGVALVAVARAVGLKKRLLPRTVVDPLVLLIVVLFVLTQFSSAARERSLVDLKTLTVAFVVFYASATVASRPHGSRWIWIAFPLANALIGIHALWSASLGPGTLYANLSTADQVWGTKLGGFQALLVALPVTVGLTANAGQVKARVVWLVAALAGCTALYLHWTSSNVLSSLVPATDPLTALHKVIASAALLTVAYFAWVVRRLRRHEGPRWFAVAFIFLAFGVLELVWSALSGPALPLLVVAAGLVGGTHQADLRALARRADATAAAIGAEEQAA